MILLRQGRYECAVREQTGICERKEYEFVAEPRRDGTMFLPCNDCEDPDELRWFLMEAQMGEEIKDSGLIGRYDRFVIVTELEDSDNDSDGDDDQDDDQGNDHDHHDHYYGGYVDHHLDPNEPPGLIHDEEDTESDESDNEFREYGHGAYTGGR
jgi:hypothetical protein